MAEDNFKKDNSISSPKEKGSLERPLSSNSQQTSGGINYRRVKPFLETNTQKQNHSSTNLNYHHVTNETNTIITDKHLKSEKLKRNLSKKSKIAIISSSIGVILLIGLAVFFSIMLKPVLPLDLPQNFIVEVINFDNKIFVQTPLVEGAKYYFFEITPENEPTALVTSETNVIDMSYFMNRGATFTIKAGVQGEDERTKSKPSNPIVYVSQKKLATPNIYFNIETQLLEWDYSLGANEYHLYYTKGSISNKIEIPASQTLNNRGSINPKEDYDLPLGVYNICLVAVSNNNIYANSEPSNYLVMTLTEKQLAPDSVSYNLLLQTVTINALNNPATTFKILIGIDEFLFEPLIISDIYTVDFFLFNYTITVGKFIKVSAVGDGAFLKDSDFIVASAE